MHRAFSKFVLRAGVDIAKLNRASVAAGFLALALCASLGGCAEDPNYPSLSKISDLGNILTPEERQKAVQDLQKQDQARSADAVKTASK